MTGPSTSLILVQVGRIVARLIQIYALYVVFHGHYSPGGGFQGGALLAASILLLRMVNGREATQSHFKSGIGLTLGAAGALVYVGMGLLTMTQGNFLEYRRTPLIPLEAAQLASLDILIVEVGIAVAVMGILVSIFDHLTEEESG